MTPLLRKLRKSLVKPGSVRRYVLYAIGEIAFGVTRILFATDLMAEREKTEMRFFKR